MLFLSTYCRNPGLVGRGRSQSRLPRFFELGIPRMKPPSDSHQRLGRSAAKNPRDRRRLNRLRSVNIRFGLSSPLASGKQFLLRVAGLFHGAANSGLARF